MSLRFSGPMKTIGLAALVTLHAVASAGDPVTDAMQAANGPYRMALYKTNGKSQAEALQALTQAQQAWDQLGNQFSAKPAAPYDRDAAFASSVAAVSMVYAKALVEVNANQLGAAHNTLEDARDIMSDMRQRNNVVVFSDHMTPTTPRWNTSSPVPAQRLSSPGACCS